MAQLVKYLLCLHEDMSSDSQHLCKKLEVAANTCNNSDMKEIGGSVDFLANQASWTGNLQGLLKDCLEKSGEEWLGNISDANFWPPRAPQHIRVYEGTSGPFKSALRGCTDGPHTSPQCQNGMHYRLVLQIVNQQPEPTSCQMSCTHFMPNFTFLFSTIRSQMYLTDRYRSSLIS